MIRLVVKEYCDACMDFSPDIERPIKMHSGDGEVIQTDTVIKCEHRGRCESIRRYLERQQEKAGESRNAEND